MEKFNFLLQSVQEEEGRKKEARAVFLAEQAKIAEEKEIARQQEAEEQSRLNAIKLEKAKLKQDVLEKTWNEHIATAPSAPSSARGGGRKKSGGDMDMDVSDDDDGGEVTGGDLQEGIFDSDEDDDDADAGAAENKTEAESQSQSQEQKTLDEINNLFPSDTSDEEEEFDALKSQNAKVSGGNRLKRSLNTSDNDDDDELDLEAGSEKAGADSAALLKEDEGPARQRRKGVIGDDDDEE